MAENITVSCWPRMNFFHLLMMDHRLIADSADGNDLEFRPVSKFITFVVVQVWLELKMPEYMSGITLLVETRRQSKRALMRR